MAAQATAAFDLAAAAVERADDATATVPAARALAAYLQLPDGDARNARLSTATWVAFVAGDHRMVQQLAAEATGRGLADQRVVEARLRSRVLGGEVLAFVVEARADEANGSWPAVARALVAEEGRLLPAADHLLRTGSTEPGLWIFAALARLEPVQAVRLANLALAQRHLGDLAAAAANYRRATALAPDDAQIWNDYGLLLRANEGIASALPAFSRSRVVEEREGQGPAITNLVQAEIEQQGSVGADPLPGASVALALRPDAVMLRRLCLDLLLARHAAEQAPDKRAPNR